ncbi:unnamed protein product [Ceratitis capitata]|uniref:Odorant receptor n=1 Tax=Ceratitis capitata TaxID=7213 RepID=A0A811U5N1_CERCA|nr:unnamed protein product [Ceratitis capitata]
MPEDLFRIQRNCLRLMGHQDIYDDDGDDNNSSNNNDTEFSSVERKSLRQRLCFRHLQTMKYVLLLLLMMSAQLPMMDYIIYHIDDLELATACLSIVFTNILTVIKTSTFLAYKREFKSLMTEFELMYDELRGAGAKPLLVTVNVGAKRFVKLYFYSVSCTGLYFTIKPLIGMFWAKFQEKPLLLELPMPMRFPFDFESTPGYQIAYVYTILITIVVVMHATSVDGLFVSFTTNLRGHFQALQYFIETNTFNKSEARLQKELRFYVEYHVRLLGLAQSVQRIFKPIIFGQFLMTSLQVCVIIYQLVMSSAVGTAVQMSQWYNLPPRHRHVLRLMMVRSQREIIISAGFYEASLANFMSSRHEPFVSKIYISGFKSPTACNKFTSCLPAQWIDMLILA